MALEAQGYSQCSIDRHKTAFRRLARFHERKHMTAVTESGCLACASALLGKKVTAFHTTRKVNVNSALKTYKMFLVFVSEGVIRDVVLDSEKFLKWPQEFAADGDIILEHLRDEQLASSTISAFRSDFNTFLRYLRSCHIASLKRVTAQTIESFIESKKGFSSTYRYHLLKAVKKGLFVLYAEGLIPDNVASAVPQKFRVTNNRMPYLWTADEVRRLLAATERNSPTGKRNYAILLLIAKLGLRQGDVRDLRTSSIDWEKKELTIVMNKTQKQLVLPLLDDVAWALIDYLKNGRPKTDSDRVFVSHLAPFRELGSMTRFRHVLTMAMRRAGIVLPIDMKHGLHSLRSTLARTLLESDTPLPIVSGVLGHTDMRTTGAYIKMDLAGLARCAIDPMEVTR